MYRYLGAGLPNVYLGNGYSECNTPYGKAVSIHDLEGLHSALGEMIASNPNRMTGYEFRFLRTELDLSQAVLAACLGCDEQSVARWEKGKSKKVSATAERLLRVLYQETKLGKKKLAPLLERLQKIDGIRPEPSVIIANESNNNWSAMTQALSEDNAALYA